MDENKVKPSQTSGAKFRKFYNNNKGWLYLLPILILMAVFTFYPLIKTILISFDPTFDPVEQKIHFSKFSFQMYKELGGRTVESGSQVNEGFGRYLKNTLLIVFITVPISTILALAISAGLMSIKKVRSFFQTIFFLPYITNTIAIGLVFAVLYDYNNGLINQFLKLFGMSKVNWLTSANGSDIPKPTYTAMMTVALTYIIWQALPFKILIFVGAIQSINPQYYQAAQIDHAGKWKTFRRITLPQISPMLLYVIITSLIGSFKTYAAIIGLFPPGSYQIGEMNTIVGFVYEQLARGSDGGYPLGAAAAVVLFIIILAMTGINTYFAKKRVHY